ncbi:MAG: lamin tail domain-containing protein [Bacillota bacterium]
MPELNASGDIFTLGASAGFDEGIVRGKVGAGARLSFEGEFALCHGLNAALTAEAVAEVEGALTLLWVLAGRARGQASAAAGIKVDGRITVDLFDEFGLSAEAAAFAEASLAGRLAVGLDLQEIAALARQQLPDLAYEILVAFLNEVVIEAGVWGKVSFAAMAKAHLNIRGSLKDDANAGFLVEMGTEVGWGGGAGYEFFGGIRFTNPKRFFLTASERITRELAREARRRLPPEFRPGIAMLELVLPITLNGAYELGQLVALQSLSPSGDLVRPFNANFAAQLQRFLLDRLAEAGIQLLGGAIEEAVHRAVRGHLTESQRQQLITRIEALIAELDRAELTAATLTSTLTQLVEILTVLLPGEAAEWRRPLTIAWLALVSAERLRHATGSLTGSASAGMVGLGTVTSSGSVLHLPEPPQVIREELEEFFEGAPQRIEFRHAVDYLIGTGAAPLLHMLLPDLALLLEKLSRSLDLTPGALVEAALHGAVGGDLTETQLYTVLRGFAKEAIDGSIMADILPELRARMGESDEARLWLDEVARPSLLMTSGFLFDQLDRLVAGGILRDDYSAFLNTLRTGLSVLAGKIFVRNVIVVGDILLNHVIGELHGGFRTLEQAVRSNPNHILTTAGLSLVPSLLPPLTPLPPNLAEPTRELIAELCGAGADASSQAIWTGQRRRRLRELAMRLLLSVDGQVDYADRNAVEAFLVQLFECAYIPDPAGLMDLHDLHMELLQAQLEVTFPRVSDALSDFFLRLTYESVDAMDRAARQLIDDLAAAVQAAWEEFQRWRAEVERRVAEAQAAARALADALEEAGALLRDPARRREILDRLLLDGIAAAEEGARKTPGFDLLPPDQQRQAIALAVSGFVLAFNLVRPALEVGLAALGLLADELGELVDGAADLPDLISRLGTEAVEKVRKGVEDALGAFGIALPPELTVADVAETAKAALQGLTLLRSALAEALAARQAEREAERREREARQRREAERARWEAEREAQAAALGGPIAIQILSPLPLDGRPESSWAYGPEVPVRIRIQGARPSFVQAGSPRRVFLALNGQPLPLSPSAWSYDAEDRSLNLTTSLRLSGMPLKPGINLLECSVANGAEAVVRQRVIFAVNPTAPLRAALAVEPALSLFDTPGDDHGETHRERVTLRNTGTLPVNLGGWRLADRARHQFPLPERELLPGATLSVYTGRGRNSETALYWGRARAVWNNRGDAVYLIDPDRVVRAEYVYEGARGGS